MTKEEKELFDERINGLGKLINAQFVNVHDKLDNIEKQTIKTNNRVTHLEDEVGDLKINAIESYIKCPLKPKVEKIETNLLEYNMFKKYPKFFIVSSIVMGLFIIFEVISQTGLI